MGIFAGPGPVPPVPPSGRELAARLRASLTEAPRLPDSVWYAVQALAASLEREGFAAEPPASPAPPPGPPQGKCVKCGKHFLLPVSIGYGPGAVVAGLCAACGVKMAVQPVLTAMPGRGTRRSD